jgi:hypothetical protein
MNQAWATSHGFKGGAQGFKDFTMDDADEITKHLGIKLWDRKGAESGLIVQ